MQEMKVKNIEWMTAYGQKTDVKKREILDRVLQMIWKLR